MSKNGGVYLLIGIAFILGVGLGLIGNKFLSPKTPAAPSAEGLYTSQTAFIKGQVTRVTRDSLAVKNIASGATGNIKISNSLVINKPSGQGSVASPSSNLRDIELDKDALITLEMIDGVYQATSVQFTPPTPSLPPPASPRAKSSPTNKP